MVSEKRQMVYIDTPKTGSTTINSICESHDFKLIRYLDTNDKKFFHYHQRWVPEVFRDYLTFASVRNPYERLYSLYQHDFKHKYNFLRLDIRTFQDYVEGLVYRCDSLTQEDLLDDRKYIYLPQHKYLSVSRVDKIVRMENLHSDLSELGLDMNQELTLNKGDYLDKWSDIKTPELIEVINLWAGKDFDHYGYERL